MYLHSILYEMDNKTYMETVNTKKAFDILSDPKVRTLELKSTAPKAVFRQSVKRYNRYHGSHITTRGLLKVSFE